MEENAKRLMGALKVISANIKTLHRHLVGGNWNDEHELLAKYYKLIDDYEDSVVETFISLGIGDVSIKEASETFRVLEANRDFSSYEAFSIVKVYFEKLIEMFDAVKEGLPDYVASKFEEYQYALSLEANYKLARFLKDKYKKET